MRICKSYREFKKIIRKANPRKVFPFLVFYVRRSVEADEVLRSSSLYCDACLRKMVSIYKDNRNQVVRCNGHFGILRGIKITNEDYFYLLEIGDEEITCFGDLVAV